MPGGDQDAVGIMAEIWVMRITMFEGLPGVSSLGVYIRRNNSNHFFFKIYLRPLT